MDWKDDFILFSRIHCLLPVRYDFIQCREIVSNLYIDNFFRSRLWSTTSNAFLKSKNIAPTVSPLSILLSQLSTSFIRVVLQEWYLRKPDCDLCNNWYLFRYPNKCLVTCFFYYFLNNRQYRDRPVICRVTFGTPFMYWVNSCWFETVWKITCYEASINNIKKCRANDFRR